MQKLGDKGQIKLSFGMIFSIILIIIFVAFAGYAIMKLFDFQNVITAGQFINNLQEDIDKIWTGGVGSQEISYSVPQKAETICFIDYGSSERGDVDGRDLYEELQRGFVQNENLFFYPSGSSDMRNGFNIRHIDLAEITRENNPLCFDVNKGKIRLVIKMDAGESLVKIENA